MSAGQRETALEYLEIGQKEGARLVTGGDVPEVPDGANGFYLRPAILADVDNAWRVAQEEIFGPVACVIPFDTEEEAIRLANETEYGLWFDLDARISAGRSGSRRGSDRRAERELVPQRPHRGAVRRLAKRHRSRDGDACGEPVHRGQERLLLGGVAGPKGRNAFVPRVTRSVYVERRRRAPPSQPPPASCEVRAAGWTGGASRPRPRFRRAD